MYLTSGSFTVAQWNNGKDIGHLGSSFCWQNLSGSVNKSIYSRYNSDGTLSRDKDSNNIVQNNKMLLTEARLIIIFEKE